MGALVAGDVALGADPDIVQQRTDAYAVQHPLNPDPRNRRSVAVHLMSLGAHFVAGMRPSETTQRLGTWIRRTPDYPRLEPPPSRGAITVVDALVSLGSVEARRGMSTAWARSAWEAWASCHSQVLGWLREQGLRV